MDLSRISCSLPSTLVDDLQRHADGLGMSRQEIIQCACEQLVREFDRIDAEFGVPCTCGETLRGDGQHYSFCHHRAPAHAQ